MGARTAGVRYSGAAPRLEYPVTPTRAAGSPRYSNLSSHPIDSYSRSFRLICHQVWSLPLSSSRTPQRSCSAGLEQLRCGVRERDSGNGHVDRQALPRGGGRSTGPNQSNP